MQFGAIISIRQVYMGIDSHSLHEGSIPQPFSNHNADSIEHVELDTKRKKRRE